MLIILHHFQVATLSALSVVNLACIGNVQKIERDGLSKTTPQVLAEQALNRPMNMIIDDRPCPVFVKLLSVAPGKPPSKIYRVRLQLTNRQSGTIWLLFRFNQPLPDSGRFNGHTYEKQSFSSTLYTKRARNEKGQAVIVNFLGEDTFTAIRLPKDADITFDYFVFEAFAEVSDFQIWEVDSLLVNGKTPVEKWLPYPVLSDQRVHLGRHENVTSLNWDTRVNGYRTDYPDEKVEFVTAHAVNKCAVPLKQ